MKLVKRCYKIVNYFGIELSISQEHDWLAVDRDGELYSYEYRPVIEDDIGWWDSRYDTANPELIAIVDLEGINWKETLRKV